MAAKAKQQEEYEEDALMREEELKDNYKELMAKYKLGGTSSGLQALLQG